MMAAPSFKGHFLPKKCLGKRSIREYSTSKKTDNIVLIEVDSEDFGDVIILDVPESFQKKFRKNPDPHVIKIDDEDDGESGTSVSDMDIDPTTSNKFSPTSAPPSSNCANTDATRYHKFPSVSASCSSTSEDVEEDCSFVNEGNTPVKLSKSKRTYSGKTISRNHYGLSPDSDSSSESDCSDCELMEGSVGKLREDWEKASTSRRRETNHSHYDVVDEAGTSAVNQTVNPSNEESAPRNSKQASQQRNSSDDNHVSNGQKLVEESEFFQKDSNARIEASIRKFREHWKKDSTSRRRETNHHHYGIVNETGTSAANQTVHHGNEESAARNSEPTTHESNGQELDEESKFFQKDSYANQMDANFTRRRDSYSAYSDFKNKGDTSTPHEPVDDESGQNANEDTDLPNEESCFRSSFDHGRYDHLQDSPKHLPDKSKDYNAEEMGKLFTGNFCTDIAKGMPCQEFEFDNPPIEQGFGRPTMLSNNSSSGHNGESNSSLDQNDILTDRQKIKETDEYKRAMEEEWASRQEQLQRQAEEAQRLRSRKRAERLRIMDNERRQKLRLDEIRETRRKDEENLNLKDKLRVEIRKELRRLESICPDMTSLLRSLGIHINPYPSASEVQAAYKRACLKFHPDRLSATDLRQQVEAEEKFKLISTMKEKISKNMTCFR